MTKRREGDGRTEAQGLALQGTHRGIQVAQDCRTSKRQEGARMEDAGQTMEYLGYRTSSKVFHSCMMSLKTLLKFFLRAVRGVHWWIDNLYFEKIRTIMSP